ncbi:MAG: hypothetical protein Q7V19_11335 [Bacteroidales bacterium]|nr:hypothetical protein [Bacteroidales bacterium]MDP2237867.1 hypothetical protein [Bacteroidales bacterium]
MAKDFIIERLKKEFEGRESFLREELLDFYRYFEPELKETTFRWRIYHLKSKQVITPISRGQFTLSFKPVFIPDLEDAERKIFSKLEKQFPSLKICIWSTKIANEFMLHIPGKFITILQVEKEAIESVYSFLKDQNFPNVFIEPKEKEIERYIYESETAIVLKSLVSKSPTQKVNTVATTTLEKLIVDLYCDKKLFAAFQGSELVHIVNNAYKRYSIDFTKLFHYAKRRSKDAELVEFFSDKTDIPNSILND